jgi:nascent polypeptide-associated complex subunit alpha
MMRGGGGNHEMRRMMDKMGLDMNELSNVQEVIIKTDKKEIIISKPAVTEMKAKDNSIFTVTADSYEEKELEVPIFSEEDIQLVSLQAGVDDEKARIALEEANGDLAKAILNLTSA